MDTKPISLFDKVKIWLFSQFAWRLIYRTAFTRLVFHHFSPLFFRNEVEVKPVLGQKLRLNPNRSVLEMKLTLLGVYEPEMVQYFRDNVKTGMTVVDIGANIGVFSLIAAELVGPSGKVIAYEPHPATYAELCANIALNGHKNIIPVQCAISAEAGSLQMAVCSDCDLNSVALKADRGMIEVKCQTLDASLEELGVASCDLIKMDIEGAEWFAIRGMGKTLDSNPALRCLVELHNPQIRSLGGDPEQLLDFFLQHGFKLYELNMWRGLNPVSSAGQARIHGHLLCLRDKQA